MISPKCKKPNFKPVAEKDVQDTILAYLKAASYFAWRVPLSGLLQHGARGKLFVRPNPMKGFPDIQGVLKNRPGKMFVIECKSTKGKLRPEQESWKSALEGSGVIYILARDVATVIDTLKEVDHAA